MPKGRGVAQLASALGSGPRGRRFKSVRPDHLSRDHSMAKKILTNKRLHLYYSGSVQGIGFRYTAQRIAESLKLTGWVRNLSDGRVEVTVEGSEPEIESFLQKINDIFKGYAWNTETQWDEATGEFMGFDIRF